MTLQFVRKKKTIIFSFNIRNKDYRIDPDSFYIHVQTRNLIWKHVNWEIKLNNIYTTLYLLTKLKLDNQNRQRRILDKTIFQVAALVKLVLSSVCQSKIEPINQTQTPQIKLFVKKLWSKCWTQPARVENVPPKWATL